ncbi:disintegrin-like metalloprotease [Cordyceps javanica]|uniref:Disintegrin and metalloproteinase domain-containing protein B n=1 Tax=Cordyceps javanica TaxID=43265 RepID=A0A545UPX9_9HYPO|nr:disintegrin-like metalloprotease [Cordyceps javanica]TQW03086.1 disintegrin-like metalloprotease [Cordyceps javanica]
MVALRSLVAAVASAALLLQTSIAESFKRNPVDYVTLIDNVQINTPSHRVTARSKFDLTFTLHDGHQKIRLALEPNDDLIPDDLAVTVLGSDGDVAAAHPVLRSDHKVFKGHAYIQRHGMQGWSAAGWARIMVLKDGDKPVFDGAFRIDGNNHHVETAAKYRLVKHEGDPSVQLADENDADKTMVVWRDSDIEQLGYSQSELKHRSAAVSALCASDMLTFNSKYDPIKRDFNPLQSMPTHQLFGRQSIDGGGGGDPAGNLISSIGSIEGCPKTKKVALVGLATDCTYWGVFGSKDAIQKHVLGVVNKASELYESTFKISLAVRNLTVIEANCSSGGTSATPWNVDCSPSFSITDRLNTFSAWRGKSLDKNAYWTLLTKCPTDNAVGLAWRGQLCRQGSAPNGGTNDTIASANVVVNGPNEWQIFAHETGHTFGAVHDCTPDQCPVKPTAQSCCPLKANQCDAGGQFIMNPSTANGITQFSPCTIGNICSGLKGNVKSDCLTDNRNVETITESFCGNGIVEPGEDCDCGGPDSCGTNKCCNPKTCKFSQGSVCDRANEDCCTDDCQFASSSTVCRASTSECDPEEKCPGDSAKCPPDEHKKSGESCGNGLECASGQCTSRDRQCQVAAGGLTHSNNTKACRNDCLMLCESPSFMGGSCAFYNQNFLDGTSCSGGGRCQDGQCKGSNWWKEFTQWFTNNKAISIPVTTVVGLLILAILSSCLCSCIRRVGRRRRVPGKPISPPPSNGSGAWNPYANAQWQPQPGPTTTMANDYSVPPPPPMRNESYGNNDNSYSNGVHDFAPPPHPPTMNGANGFSHSPSPPPPPPPANDMYGNNNSYNNGVYDYAPPPQPPPTYNYGNRGTGPRYA